VNTKIQLEQAKQRYGDSHERTKLVQKELEILYKNDKDFQDKLFDCTKSIELIQKQRDDLQSEWQT
jgi:hypothetical protein